MAHVLMTKLQSAMTTSRSVPVATLSYSLRSILTAPANSRLLQHPAYVPVADVPALPRVLLLGDSISIGYTLPVRRALKGIANIHRPAANCTSSRNGLLHLKQWLGEGKWDIVHLNFGLHDCVRDGDEPAVPIEEYRSNLETIFRTLHETGARLAWASTTPVPKDMLYRDPVTGRQVAYREADIAAYNAAAAEIARSHGAEIDALDAFARPCLSELQMANDIHFNKAGYAVLGKHVAGFLREML